MLKLGTIRFKGKCDRHLGYHPDQGAGAIRGGCSKCQLLFDIYETHSRLARLITKVKNDAAKPQAKGAAAGMDERQGALF